MKAFEFVALDSSGKKKVGTIEAWSLSEAKRKIQQRGFYLASIKIQGSSVGSGVSPPPIQSGRSRVKPVLSKAEGREGIQGTSSYSVFQLSE